MLLREEYVSSKVGYSRYCSELYSLVHNYIANASTVNLNLVLFSVSEKQLGVSVIISLHPAIAT
jgi:hypothetical protein